MRLTAMLACLAGVLAARQERVFEASAQGAIQAPLTEALGGCPATERPTSAAISSASQSAIGPLSEEAVRRLRGIAAAIGSGEDTATQAYVSASDPSSLGLRLITERTSRLIRVQVQRAVPAVLDETIVDVDIDVEPAVARDSILQWMAQFGISENNLVQIAAERNYSPNPSPVRCCLMNGRLGALRSVLETPPQECSRYLVLSALRVSPVPGFMGDEAGVTGLFEFNVE